MTISSINCGISRVKEGVNYPIRDFKGGSLYSKNIYKCIYCGKVISKGANQCKECYNIKRRIAERPSREELKLLIRTKPFTQIGKKYGVTDNAVRKWCDMEKLPRKKTEINQYTDEEWEKI